MVRLIASPFMVALRLLRSCARLHPAVFSVSPLADNSSRHRATEVSY